MIIAIDPGTTQSGWCLVDGHKIIRSGVDDNNWIKACLHDWPAHQMAIEMIASYGMPVGKETFETCVWIGRFMENFSGETELIYRKQVLKHFGIKEPKGADAKIRQLLIKKFGDAGTKSKPGPTFGITSHAWQALSIAATALKL